MARCLVPTPTFVGVSSSDIDSVGLKVLWYMPVYRIALHCIAAPKCGIFRTPYIFQQTSRLFAPSDTND